MTTSRNITCVMKFQKVYFIERYVYMYIFVIAYEHERYVYERKEGHEPIKEKYFSRYFEVKNTMYYGCMEHSSKLITLYFQIFYAQARIC